MKIKILIYLSAIFLISCNDESIVPNKSSDGCIINLWMKSGAYGSVSVYIDNVYQGEITAYYQNNPYCDSQGCVTVASTIGMHHIYAVGTINGIWDFDMYVAEGCNSKGMQ